MSKFSEVFKNKDFSLLWISQIISQFGDRLNQMALIALVFSRAPGSTWQMAKVFSFTIIPVFIFGPIAGAYVDRWSKPRTMFICDLIRALLVFVIAFFLVDKPLFSIYLLIFLVFSISRFFVPAKMSIIPDIVKPDELLLANSLVTTTGMIAAVLGLGVGGLLVSPQVLGVRGGFFLDAATFLISAVMIFFISKGISFQVNKTAIAGVSKDIVEVIRHSIARDIKEGVSFLASNVNTRYISMVLFTLFSALGAVYVLIIVFLQEALAADTAQIGLLAVFLGVSLFIGSLLYGRLGQKFALLKIIFSCLIISGISLALFSYLVFAFKNFAAASALSLILGVSLSPIMIASNTLIHKLSSSQMMARVFSSLEVIMHIGFLIAMLLTAVIAERVQSIWILVSVGIGIVIFGFIGLAREKKWQSYEIS